MVLNPRALGCVKEYADLLRKTIRLLTHDGTISQLVAGWYQNCVC
jgi:hypothetical protein